MKPEIITVDSIDIDRKKVLYRMGYVRSKTQIDKNTQNLIDTLIDEAATWLEPQAIFRTEEIAKATTKGVCIKDCDFCITSSYVGKLLLNSYKTSFFAVTIGAEITEKTQSFLNEEMVTQAAIVDAIGSVVVESLAEWMNEYLVRKGISERARLTKRYSPGYGDWAIETQNDLLFFLDARSIGISVAPSGVMVPEKSVSALVGWERKE